jgi:acyl-coenzyme A synthetase/AMP-(fatty) acid ligase
LWQTGVVTVIPIRLIADHAESNPAGTAIVTDTAELTWKEFLEQSTAVHAWFTGQLDPGREHRVLTFARNGVELVVVGSAVSTLGVPLVGVDPARDVATVAAQLAAVDPTVVVLDSTLPGAEAVAAEAAAIDALVLDVAMSGGPTGLPGLADIAACDWERRPWTRPPFVALGFTSGSTGVPKLFTRRTRTENQRESFLRDHDGVGPDDVYLVSSPLAHASGHVWAHAALARGATVVLADPDPDRLLDTVRRFGVTAAFMVPPTLDAFLAAACARPETDLSSLRLLLTGGRHISERTARAAAQRLGQILHVYYATTETGIATMAFPADLATVPLTAGTPMPGVWLRIVDPKTLTDVALGDVGLIAVHSPVNMDGYATESATVFKRGNSDYVLTSDYGRLDGTGRLFVSGRADTAAASKALDVVGLESELKDLSGVDDVCAFRRARGDSVEIIVAMTGDAGRSPAVHALVNDYLGSERAACVVLTVPAIPYNTAGKVDLRRLTALTPAERE